MSDKRFEFPELSDRWRKDALLRATGKEILVLASVHGLLQIARRMELEPVVEFLETAYKAGVYDE